MTKKAANVKEFTDPKSNKRWAAYVKDSGIIPGTKEYKAELAWFKLAGHK